MAIQNPDSFSRATAYPTASTTLTRSYTVASGASFLVVAVSANKFDMLAITGITYGGTALTQGATSSTSGVQPAGRIWYLAAPTAGTANIVVTTSANSSAGAFLIATFDGLNSGGTPTGAGTETASANTISPTVTVGSTATAVMVASALNGGTATAASGSTLIAGELADANGASGKGSFAYRDAAQPGVNFSLTNQLGAATLVLPGVGDTTPPTLSSPTLSATGNSTATAGVTTNEGNGTLYAVLTTSATAPTAAQVRAGQNNAGAAAAWSGNQAVSSTGAKTFSATGLTAATTYYAHFTHRDAAVNDSAVASSASATTGGAAPTINTQPGNQTVTAPATATFTVSATASAGGLTYQWQRQPAAGGGYTNLSGATSSSYTTGATSVSGGSHNNGDTYRVLVTDSNGTTTSTAATLTVNGALAGFDLSAQVFRNNTGTALASASLTFWALNVTSGALVAQITGYSTNGSGIVASKVTHASLAAGTLYRLAWEFSSGEYGVAELTAS